MNPAAYTGLLHTHTLVVALFLLLYIIKTGLLFFAPAKLQAMRENKPARIFEVILSVAFLGTGIAMWTQLPQPAHWTMLLKMVLVFGAIPLAVIGFKRSNKALAVLSVVFLFAAYGLAEMRHKLIMKEVEPQNLVIAPNTDQLVAGQKIYNAYCESCHGAKGDEGLAGAKNLAVSKLTDEEVLELIKHGKGNMAAYGEILNEEQQRAVLAYIKSLRTNLE